MHYTNKFKKEMLVSKRGVIQYELFRDKNMNIIDKANVQKRIR